jgi:phosphoglycolate phosphatase-like HAD superfamily hydrolase
VHENFTMPDLAIIADLDETLCVTFHHPVVKGVEVLRRIDATRVHVFYVTARTTASKRGTDVFLLLHDLPHPANVLYSPAITSSREHKLKCHRDLAGRFDVIASIGDAEEEAEASAAAGVPFVRVDVERPESAWAELEAMLETAGLMAVVE